jgi:hypothetical protein
MDYGVLVGINAYPYPNGLNGCLDDIIDLQAALTTLLNFSPTSIKTITDGDATAQNIKTALENTVKRLTSGDRFIFWYSGHGSQLVEGDIATDVICPVNFNVDKDTSVTVDDFHKIFSSIPAGVVAAWGSDSCHSGDLERDFYRLGVPRLFYSGRPPQRDVARGVKTFRVISDSLPNIVLMSGCRSDQTSADAYIQGRYNGAFTYYFLQQFKTASGLQTPLVQLIPQIQAALRAANYTQEPQLSGRSSAVQHSFLSVSP